MALSLGVKRGSKIKVGDTFVTVKEVKNLATILVEVQGKVFTITDLERQEILPQVFVSCGRSGQSGTQSGYSRLAFEAPKSIRIERVPIQDSGHPRSSGIR